RDPAAHPRHGARGGGHPADWIDHHHRLGQLPRPRPPAPGGRLGADDLGEPWRDHTSAVGRRRPCLSDRFSDGCGQSRRRCGRKEPGTVDGAKAGSPVTDVVLVVEDLQMELFSGEPIVEDVSFQLEPGKVLGLVGESGSGKTTTALALLGYTRPGVRIAIAAALVCRPAVVVLDEPTTGLDVVTQSHLLEEIGVLRQEMELAIVYVSHDLAVVASLADQIAVMYAGRIVEEGRAAGILAAPRHPYTWGLLSSVPDPHEPRRLRSIPGVAVGVDDRPDGCAFAPRCPQRVGACVQAMPPLDRIQPEWRVRCLEWQRTPPLAPEARTAARLGVGPMPPVLGVEGLRAEH